MAASENIASIRRDYKSQSLEESDVAQDAIVQFERWWRDAVNAQIDEVNAMTLATASAAGKPSARIVLLKGFTEKGFTFFTNYQSHKGSELHENPDATLVFFWKELERQIRISGIVEKISAEESDDYFNSRPEGSKLGAWISAQSTVISSRLELEEKQIQLTEEFRGKEIHRPPHWGGYNLAPAEIEFWQGRTSRLHDRIQYIKRADEWLIQRLSP
ncbi:pyridoxamine 5'-phosphate oxidase [soil metagenome]